MASVLVVAAWGHERDFLKELLAESSHSVDLASSSAEGIDKLKTRCYDVVLSDLEGSGFSGVEILRFTRSHHPQTQLIIMANLASVPKAVEAMREGAFAYVIKPFNRSEIELEVQRAAEHIRLTDENDYFRRELSQKYLFSSIVGRSQAMGRALEIAKLAVTNNLPILIQGEAGTGKKLLARTIHYNGPRRDRPLVKVDCVNLPQRLIELELFGGGEGESGVAKFRSHGGFWEDGGGTILLDEVGALPPVLQAKLEEALTEHQLGCAEGGNGHAVSARIVATTSSDLTNKRGKNEFNRDLLTSLSAVLIELPSLSVRREDIPLLANSILGDYCEEYGRNGLGISAEAMEFLAQADWPGNVCQLADAIERAVILCDDGVISPDDLGFCEGSGNAVGEFPRVPGATLRDIEKWVILRTLSSQNHNISKAAKLLGISTRTLRSRVKLYREVEGEEI